MASWPAGSKEAAGPKSVGTEADGDDSYHEQSAVLAPPDAGHDGGGDEDSTECPQLDVPGSGMAAGSLLRGGGEDAADDSRKTAEDVYRQCGGEPGSRIRDGQAEDVTGGHRPHLSWRLGLVRAVDGSARCIRTALGMTVTPQAMRMALARTATSASELAGDFEAVKSPIMVRSPTRQSVAMVIVAARARLALASGSQRHQSSSAGEGGDCSDDRDRDQWQHGDRGQERDQSGAPRVRA